MMNLSGLVWQNVLPCCVRIISTSAIMRLPREFERKIVDDLGTIQDIETNLFGNKDKSVIDKKPIEQILMPSEIPQIKKIKSKPIKVKSPSIIDKDLGLNYIKLNLNDPQLNSLLFTTRSRRGRMKEGKVTLEGTRLIVEAIQAGLKLQTILFSKKENLEVIIDNIKTLNNVQLFRVPQQDLRTWSTLTTCPGLIAIFDRPQEFDSQQNRSDTLPITVICDNIREPNNLGSIIRSCAAIPCEQVIVTKGCCDPWDTKSLRGGCGGQFYINIKDDVKWDSLKNILPDDYAVFIADSKSNDESVCYTKMNVIKEQHSVLVVGGETHGISEDAYRFLSENGNKGERIYIPLASKIESLNTASALTVILFEIRKKILQSTVESIE